MDDSGARSLRAVDGAHPGVGALLHPAPHIAAAADAAEAARQRGAQQQPLLTYLQADPVDGILHGMRDWTPLAIRISVMYLQFRSRSTD